MKYLKFVKQYEDDKDIFLVNKIGDYIFVNKVQKLSMDCIEFDTGVLMINDDVNVFDYMKLMKNKDIYEWCYIIDNESFIESYLCKAKSIVAE